MRNTIILSLTALIAAGVTGCNTRDLNANTASRSNSNVIVTTPTATRTPRPLNANISKEDYDRDREEYERDRGSSTIGQGINDSWLWFKTRAALATTDDLRESTINVDVVNDVITLKGTVASQAQKTRAEQVAKEIEGQKGVKNELLVRSADSMTNQMVNGNTASSNRP